MLNVEWRASIQHSTLNIQHFWSSRRLRLVAIAHPVHGVDAVELRVDRLELLTDALDVAVDGALADVVVVRVTLVRELAARLDVAGVADQRLQHEELGDGEIDEGALPADDEALHVELQRADALHFVGFARRLGAAGGAAEEHADARDQLAHGERLAKVVVAAELQAEDAVELFVARGEKEDGNGFRRRADFAAELEAVHPR